MPGRLSNIKEKASNVKDRVTGNSSDDNLGPDRGTMDQLEARQERARMEAKQEAQKEQRQQQIEQAREEAREAVEKSDGGILSRAASAVSSVADEIDIDGDGTPLAAELEDPAEMTGGGGQSGSGSAAAPSQQQSDGPPMAFEEDLAALENEVEENDREIDALEQEVRGNDSPSNAGRDESGDPLGAGFNPDKQLGYDDGGSP